MPHDVNVALASCKNPCRFSDQAGAISFGSLVYISDGLVAMPPKEIVVGTLGSVSLRRLEAADYLRMKIALEVRVAFVSKLLDKTDHRRSTDIGARADRRDGFERNHGKDIFHVLGNPRFAWSHASDFTNALEKRKLLHGIIRLAMG